MTIKHVASTNWIPIAFYLQNYNFCSLIIPKAKHFQLLHWFISINSFKLLAQLTFFRWLPHKHVWFIMLTIYDYKTSASRNGEGFHLLLSSSLSRFIQLSCMKFLRRICCKLKVWKYYKTLFLMCSWKNLENVLLLSSLCETEAGLQKQMKISTNHT